jgi:hypothetical protein
LREPQNLLQIVMENNTVKTWVKTGVVFGFAVTIIYPSMLFIPFPVQITLFFAFLFAISLAIASIGLYKFLCFNRKTVSAGIGTLFNIIACTVVFIMFALQIALFNNNADQSLSISKEVTTYIHQKLNIIQLTFDVVWDMFLSAGTLLLALNMMNHPRLGKMFGVTGILLSISLFILNVYSFPIPPADTGLIDMGPFVALWYLAVTIKITTSLKWLETPVS